MTELVLVGTDGSDTAAIAVAKAADLAGRRGARLLIVTAFSDALTTKLGTPAHNMPAPPGLADRSSRRGRGDPRTRPGLPRRD